MVKPKVSVVKEIKTPEQALQAMTETMDKVAEMATDEKDVVELCGTAAVRGRGIEVIFRKVPRKAWRRTASELAIAMKKLEQELK